MLTAAAELIVERGWDGVTTREIARRAGVNQGLLHYHFGSKERLLHAAFEAALRETFTSPGEALVAAPDLATGAAALLRDLRAGRDEPLALLSIEAMSRAARDEAIGDLMAGVLAEFRTLVSERVASAQRAGELPPELDPAGTAALLGALFDGIGLHLLIDPSIDVDRAATALATLLRRQTAAPTSAINERPIAPSGEAGQRSPTGGSSSSGSAG